MEDPYALRRWDPWVRASIGVTELTRGLDYVTSSADTFLVYLREPRDWLVRITRPLPSFFVEQLDLVQTWAELRDERALEILAQIDNQYAFIASVSGLNAGRHRWTMEWLNIVIQFTIAVELMFKHAFACYRPVDLSPQVQPVITTPGHGSYPMGHAAQAFATVVALTGLMGLKPSHPISRQLMLQARRISINRVVAGVHFPIDAAAGQVLGSTLGEYFLRASGIGHSPCRARAFKSRGSGKDPMNDYLSGGPDAPVGATLCDEVHVPRASFVAELARLAKDEWTCGACA